MKTTVKIEGMSCSHCAAHIKEALEAVEGVKSAAVSLGAGNAVVEHGEGVVPETLRAAVTEAGYKAV